MAAANTYAGFYTPTGVSPDEVKRRKSFAESLLAQASDTSAVRHPIQAVARALQGLYGGHLSGRADEEAKTQQAQAMAGVMAALGMQGGGGAAPGVPAEATTSNPIAQNPQPVNPKIYKNDEPSPLDPPSGRDRDLAIRTIYGEDPGQSALGVANVIRRRAISGQYGGDTPSDVVMAKGQFEPWSNPQARARMMALQQGSPEYERLGGVLEQAYAGNDPTGGATHFFAPKAQAALGRPVPAWGQGQGQDIGPHRFFGGPRMAQAGPPSVPQQAPTMPAAAGGLPPNMAGVISAMSNPWLGTGGQAIAGKILESQLKPRDQWKQERNPDGSIYQRNLTTGEMKAVEKSDVLPEEAVRQKERIATAGKPVTTIDQRAPDEFEKEYGQGMGKRALDVISQGDAASTDLQRSALSRAFLQSVKTGKLAPAQATIGAWARAVGIDPAKIGIDPNLPIVGQAAQSLLAQQTVGMIGAGGFPANNFSDADRKFLTGIPANISNTPEANELLHDIQDRVAQRKIDRANAWSEARGEKKSYETFEREWRKKIAGEDMFADIRTKLEAMSRPASVDDLVKKYAK